MALEIFFMKDNNMNIPNHIQQLLDARSRELTSRENAEFFSQDPREVSSREREVYKDKNIKIQKQSSREDRDSLREDVDEEKVSARPAIWPEADASIQSAIDFVSSPFGDLTVSQEEGVSNISDPRELTSREETKRFSGVSVQQVITPKGMKLAITFQQPDWVKHGACTQTTAELKKYERIREVKLRESDSEQFNLYLDNTKQMIHESKNKNIYLGRLHNRGRRSEWLYDTLVIAVTNGKIVKSVIIYIEGEEYEVALDQQLSPMQQKFYSALGFYGSIVKVARAPRIGDLPIVRFGG